MPPQTTNIQCVLYAHAETDIHPAYYELRHNRRKTHFPGIATLHDVHAYLRQTYPNTAYHIQYRINPPIFFRVLCAYSYHDASDRFTFHMPTTKSKRHLTLQHIPDVIGDMKQISELTHILHTHINTAFPHNSDHPTTKYYMDSLETSYDINVPHLPSINFCITFHDAQTIATHQRHHLNDTIMNIHVKMQPQPMYPKHCQGHLRLPLHHYTNDLRRQSLDIITPFIHTLMREQIPHIPRQSQHNIMALLRIIETYTQSQGNALMEHIERYYATYLKHYTYQP